MEANKINHLEPKSEFPKIRKKQNFRKPKKAAKNDISKMGENPFKETWRFNASVSNHQFRLTESDDKKSYSIFTADKIALNEVRKRNFTPYLLEGKYVRIHMENNQNLRSRIYRLQSCSHTLLFWILFSLDYGKDYVLINKQNLTNKLGLSKSTIYKAINQLVEEEFIRKTNVVNYYWVNVQFFFLGNRCHFLPEFVTTREGLKIEEMRDDFLKKNKKLISARLSKLEDDNSKAN